MRKKLAFLILSLCMVLCSCAKKEEALPVFRENVRLTIPGMEESVTLLWLSDLHIAVAGSSADPEASDDIAFRVQYSSYEGQTAEKQWDAWVDALNSEEADAVILGGDMLDFCSREGAEELQSGLERMNKPYLYLRADHDLLPTYQSGVDAETARTWQNALCKNEDVMSMEFDSFTLVAWNNSTSNLSDAGLERIRELAAEGKPLILLTHVPIEPLADDSLAEASKAVYNGRSLIWGYRDAEYWPEENTRKLLDLIYADDSPFVEILCGHLHLSWDGQVTEHVHEHVFPAAFARYMGVITVE